MSTYNIGGRTLEIREGKKNKDDYILLWDGKDQFTDEYLFKELLTHIDLIDKAREFINLFDESGFIDKTDECVKTTIKCRDDVIKYVNKLKINDDLKLCLASMIFRCDIDNISYECPRFNGCVRHYIQILLIFGYKFDCRAWQFKSEKLRSDLQYKSIDKIASSISSIGYSGNIYNITAPHFKDMYKGLQNNT